MVQFLVGNEPFLIHQRLTKLLHSIESPDMNVTVFTDGLDWKVVQEAASTAPFLSDKRAVVLQLSEVKGGDDLKNLSSSLPKSTDLIITASKFDKRSSLYKAFKDNIVICDKLTENKCLEYIALAAKREGKQAEQSAAVELLRRMHYEEEGVNFYAILGCVRQICLLSDLTLAAVQETVPEDVTGKVYTVTSYLCTEQKEKLFALVAYLLDTGENGIGLLSILARVFRLAWKDKVAGIKEVPLFQYKDAMCFSAEQLSKVQDICTDTINQMKDSGSGNVLLNVALVKMLQVLHH